MTEQAVLDPNATSVDWDVLEQELVVTTELVDSWLNGSGEELKEILSRRAEQVGRYKRVDSLLDAQKSPEVTLKIRQHMAAETRAIRRFEARMVISLLKMVKAGQKNGRASDAATFKALLATYLNRFPGVKAVIQQELARKAAVTSVEAIATSVEPVSNTAAAVSEPSVPQAAEEAVEPWRPEDEIELLAELPTLESLKARFAEILEGFKAGSNHSKRSPRECAREVISNKIALGSLEEVELGARSVNHFEAFGRAGVLVGLEDFERNNARLEKLRVTQIKGEQSALVQSQAAKLGHIRTTITLNLRRLVRGLEAVADTPVEIRHSVIKFMEWLSLEVIGSFVSLKNEDEDEEFLRVTNNGDFAFLMREINRLDPRTANPLPCLEDFEYVDDLRRRLLRKIENEVVRSRIAKMILARRADIYDRCRRQKWFRSRTERTTVVRRREEDN